VKATNIAILIGRAGSSGFPGKNIIELCGRPSAEYPLLSARACRDIHHVVVSTDCPVIGNLGRKHGALVLDRPEHLSGPLISPG
jgi:CMP-N-acetylneuraminic acid synthetase